MQEQRVLLIESLNLIAHKIQRMKSTFPNYCQHLEDQYEELMGHAEKLGMLPAWMMRRS